MSKHLCSKNANKSKRRYTHSLCTHQHALNIVRTPYHGPVNHLQSVVSWGLDQYTRDGQTKESDLRGFLRIGITFVVYKHPPVVIVVHPTLNGAAAFGREHRAGLANIIDPNVARTDDERHAKAAGRERAEPIMRDAIRRRDARRRRVERVPT